MRAVRQSRVRRLALPNELAGTSWEWPVAAACIGVLTGLVVGDILTPADVVLSAGAVFPILLAVWTLSARPALTVVFVAGMLLVLEGLMGAVNGITIGVMILADASLALLAHLYARRIATLPAAANEPAHPSSLDLLTRREREVIALAAHGRTASEIADLLHIGERTVETHLANAYPKLGVRSKLELVRQAANLGM